jgi:hypothetical protein
VEPTAGAAARPLVESSGCDGSRVGLVGCMIEFGFFHVAIGDACAYGLFFDVCTLQSSSCPGALNGRATIRAPGHLCVSLLLADGSMAP